MAHPTYQAAPDTHATRRVRAAAETLCQAVEKRMDRLMRLVEEEIALVRDGKLFALRDLEKRKVQAARDFITGLEAVKNIRSALELECPEAVERLRRRHAEFKAMLQLNLAALETARDASNQMLESIAGTQGIVRRAEAAAAPIAYARS